TVEMREEIAPAGGLPLQRVAEIDRVELHEHQVALPREVSAQGLLELDTGREVDEPVAQVHGRAAVGACGGGLAPLLGGTDLVDTRHRSPAYQAKGQRAAGARKSVAARATSSEVSPTNSTRPPPTPSQPPTSPST